MVRIIGRRLLTGLVTLTLVTLLVFLLVHLSPGSPLADSLDAGGLQRVSPEVVREIERIYHLDQPLHRQYFLWLGNLLRGDLGVSIQDRRPVTERIVERLGLSLSLNGLALLTMILVSVPLGTLAAWRPGSRIDRWAGTTTYMAYAVPTFWAALLLQIVLAVRLDWFPLAGTASDAAPDLGFFAGLLDRVRHLVLPVICLSYGGIAYLSRFVRSTLIDNLSPEARLAARARGLAPFGVLVRHGFRLAAVPMLTLAGLLLPALVGGSVIVESVFSLPGLGRLFVESASSRDLPVLLGLTLLSGAATLCGILAADLAYIVADPRVRRG